MQQRAEITMTEPTSRTGDHSVGNGTKGNGGSSSQGQADTIFSKSAPAGAAKKTSEVLGEIVWLMSQSPLHRQFFISDLEWLVMTPVVLQQFRLFYDATKPIGALFWGTVNEEVEQRLQAGVSRLRPQDWKSGDRLWVVEVLAPFGGAEEMVKDFKDKVFPERQATYLSVTAAGDRKVEKL
jgi:cytolysin-activating lysine-acyltransferase